MRIDPDRCSTPHARVGFASMSAPLVDGAACTVGDVQSFLRGADQVIRRLTGRSGDIAEGDVPRLPTVTEATDGAHSGDEEQLCLSMKCFLQRRQCVVAHHNAKCVTPTRSEGSQSLLQTPLQTQAWSRQWQVFGVSCAAVVVVDSFSRLLC